MSENRYKIPGFDDELRIQRLQAHALTEVVDWSRTFLHADDLAARNPGMLGDKPIRICVLDTGCEMTHPDLDGATVGYRNFTSASINDVTDRVGHGTWCAGFIGARANQVGIRGIAHKCELLIGKVLGDDGSGSETGIIKGLEWGAANGAKFFSLSLGGPEMSDTLHSLIRELTDDGRFVFAAAGNDGGPVNWPAAFAECVGVAAVGKDGKLTKFSSRGPEVDVAAPGVEMLSTVPGNGYARMSGTSMATPCACAVAACFYGAFDGQVKDSREMSTILYRTGLDIGGYRLIDPRKLLAESAGKQQPKSEIPLGTWFGRKWWLGSQKVEA